MKLYQVRTTRYTFNWGWIDRVETVIEQMPPLPIRVARLYVGMLKRHKESWEYDRVRHKACYRIEPYNASGSEAEKHVRFAARHDFVYPEGSTFRHALELKKQGINWAGHCIASYRRLKNSIPDLRIG
jgi:hypothetical protein